MKELSDDEVFGSAARKELSDKDVFAPAKELSDVEVFGSGPLTYAKEFATSIAEGVKSTISTGLKGEAALSAVRAEEQLAQLNAEEAKAKEPLSEDPSERAARRTQRSVVHPSAEAVAERKQGLAERASRPATENPLYKAGAALEEFGKDWVGPSPGWEGSITRDLGGGFGSVAANIGTALIPATGPALSLGMMVGGGAGEAYERAIKFGATEEKARESAKYGTISGATELADLALLRSGVGGKARSTAAKVFGKLIEGGAINGTQEAAQQAIQNWIAKEQYNPKQTYSEGVIYNGIIGSVVGGATSVALGGGGRTVPETPVQPGQAEEFAKSFGPQVTVQPYTGPDGSDGGAPTPVPVEGQTEEFGSAARVSGPQSPTQPPEVPPSGPASEVPAPTEGDPVGKIPDLPWGARLVTMGPDPMRAMRIDSSPETHIPEGASNENQVAPWKTEPRVYGYEVDGSPILTPLPKPKLVPPSEPDETDITPWDVQQEATPLLHNPDPAALSPQMQEAISYTQERLAEDPSWQSTIPRDKIKSMLPGFVPMSMVQFPWGTATIHTSETQQEGGEEANVHFLSNGAVKISTKAFDRGTGRTKLVPYEYFIELHGTDPQRNTWLKPSRQTDISDQLSHDEISKLAAYVELIHQDKQLRSRVANYGRMRFMSDSGNGYIRYSQKLKEALSEDKDTIPNWTMEEVGRIGLNAKSFVVPEEQVDVSRPAMHDSTVIRISDVESRTLSDLTRENFGEAFDKYVFDIGTLLVEFRDAVAWIMHKQFPTPPGPRGETRLERSYYELFKKVVGVSIDPSYRGVAVGIPVESYFLNLAVPEAMNDPIIASHALLGTMEHELAHFNDRTEDRQEMQRIQYVLYSSSDFDYQEFKQRFIDVVARNWDIQQFMSGVMTNGVFDVQSSGGRFDEPSRQARIGGGASNVGAVGARAERGPAVYGGASRGADGTPAGPGLTNSYDEITPSPTNDEHDAVATRRADQRHLDREAPGVEAAPRQQEVSAILTNLEPAFQAVGGLPPAVRSQAAHASRMNWFYKYAAGLSRLVNANPYFGPLLRYAERIRLMHNEESIIHNEAVRILKRWRALGEEGDRLTGFLDDLANMVYRTPHEVSKGIRRMPTQAETSVLIAKHKMTAEGLKVAGMVRDSFANFLIKSEVAAIQTATRILVGNPAALTKKINEIKAQTKALLEKPYFPMLRYGRHFVMVKDAGGKVADFQLYERRGVVSAEARQQRAFGLAKAQWPGHTVTFGVIPEEASTFLGLPPTLFDQIRSELQPTPAQLEALQQIHLSYAPSLSARKRMMKSDYTPGYSHDFKRSFARYFFHGARYYSRAKHAYDLQSFIDEAKATKNDNKANLIAGYMADHLKNTVLDVKGDWGQLKGAAFTFFLGYVPMAAFTNLYQLTNTFYYLSAKFGGEHRVIPSMIKTMAKVRNYYKKESYLNATDFDMRAMSYGIETGRLSDTQAAELASLSMSSSLETGFAGNAMQKGFHQFRDKGAKMFDLAEQFLRRVTFQSALDLAMKHPNSKAVKKATRVYESEMMDLQVASGTRGAFTPSEAAAIVTAAHVTDETQFVYAHYDRPRHARGGLMGTVLVFQHFVQSMSWLLGQNKADFLPRWLIGMAFIGGAAGMPGYEEFKELLRALAHRLYGKDFNLERWIRDYVMATTNGTVPPDLILHGLSRQGMGIPALVDMMGSAPGRGLDPTKPAQNVPFPVLDRSRALSFGSPLPFSPSKLFGPQETPDHVVAEQVQKASGAVFGVGFNLFKAIMDHSSEVGDFKRWERAMPSAMKNASKAYRAFDEGRERLKGGPDSAPTLVNYDVRDKEQMMEVLAMAAGYSPLRRQAKVDHMILKAETIAFHDLKRKGLLEEFFEAQQGKDPKEISGVIADIKKYNAELPTWAKARSISGETIHKSVQTRALERAHKEVGIPRQISNRGIAKEMDRLFPEATIDVRKVK